MDSADRLQVVICIPSALTINLIVVFFVFSIDKPIYIDILLHNIGTHVDPSALISKIDENLEIPGLRDSLVQIIKDYR